MKTRVLAFAAVVVLALSVAGPPKAEAGVYARLGPYGAEVHVGYGYYPYHYYYRPHYDRPYYGQYYYRPHYYYRRYYDSDYYYSPYDGPSDTHNRYYRHRDRHRHGFWRYKSHRRSYK